MICLNVIQKGLRSDARCLTNIHFKIVTSQLFVCNSQTFRKGKVKKLPSNHLVMVELPVNNWNFCGKITDEVERFDKMSTNTNPLFFLLI